MKFIVKIITTTRDFNFVDVEAKDEAEVKILAIQWMKRNEIYGDIWSIERKEE